MTPADIASQELHAAWVSAYSAVAQAGGAVLAIGASVFIALRAEKRAGAAELRAEQRIIAAEAAAVARAEKAERDALEREERHAQERQKAVVAPLVAAMKRLRDRLLTEALSREQDYRQVPARATQTIIGAVRGADTSEILTLASELSARAETGAIADFVLRAKGVIRGIEDIGAGGFVARDWVSTRRDAAAAVQALIEEADALF